MIGHPRTQVGAPSTLLDAKIQKTSVLSKLVVMSPSGAQVCGSGGTVAILPLLPEARCHPEPVCVRLGGEGRWGFTVTEPVCVRLGGKGGGGFAVTQSQCVRDSEGRVGVFTVTEPACVRLGGEGRWGFTVTGTFSSQPA